mgnify:FL=1
MKRIILSILFAGFSASVFAQMTLETCQELAREHYPEVKQYDLIRLTEQYDLSNAARAWLPQLSLSAQATWQNEVPEFPEALSGMLSQAGVTIPGLKKDQYKVGLELNQTIWDGGKSNADKRLARTEAAEQRAMTDVDLYTLKKRVNELYFGILLLEEKLSQTYRTITLLESNLDKMCSLVTNGTALASDADAVEAELLTARQQATQIEASRTSYRKMLELFIGEPLQENLLRPEFEEMATTELTRPELVLFDAKKNRLAAQEALIKSSTRPKFGFFAQGYYGYPSMDYFASMMSNEWRWNLLTGIRMSWNFGAYYTKKNSLNKLRTAQQSIDLQRDVFRFETDLQISQETGDIARLRKTIADDARIVSLRQSVREAAESKLRNGIIDTNDLLQKITDEAAARSAQSVHEIELLKALYELKHTINQ